MTNEEFQKILEENKNNNTLICYEYFNSTYKTSFDDFIRAFPSWLTMMNPMLYFNLEGNIHVFMEKATEHIVNHLKIKHSIKN